MALNQLPQDYRRIGMHQPVNGGGYEPYAAGNKHYGGGRSFPTNGPVDPSGYRERDAMAQARRNAILRQIQSKQSGNYRAAGTPRPIGGL